MFLLEIAIERIMCINIISSGNDTALVVNIQRNWKENNKNPNNTKINHKLY